MGQGKTQIEAHVIINPHLITICKLNALHNYTEIEIKVPYTPLGESVTAGMECI